MSGYVNSAVGLALALLLSACQQQRMLPPVEEISISPRESESGMFGQSAVKNRVRTGQYANNVSPYQANSRGVSQRYPDTPVNHYPDPRARSFAQAPRRSLSNTYTVQLGDNLTDIARRANISVNSLVSQNQLRSPDIYPGQQLVIMQDGSHFRRSSAPRQIRSPALPPRPQQPFVARQSSPKPRSEPLYTGQEVGARSLLNRPTDKTLNNGKASFGYNKRSFDEKVILRNPSNLSDNQGLMSWLWPAKGQVVRQFNLGHPSSPGIDIAGNVGDPVFASAGGKVVYIGEGLRSFGRMVILSHDEGVFSAYGKLGQVRVREDQTVKSGEVIATVGGTEMGSIVHFQIRVEGQPVNPLAKLPPRG